mmetsp:Transcript_37000/g.104452  ORF Transcript_37000/g.104452 Transcript_37000/m.104452 type:complete len:203 (-) Transcript_37000:397-1005(-)
MQSSGLLTLVSKGAAQPAVGCSSARHSREHGGAQVTAWVQECTKEGIDSHCSHRYAASACVASANKGSAASLEASPAVPGRRFILVSCRRQSMPQSPNTGSLGRKRLMYHLVASIQPVDRRCMASMGMVQQVAPRMKRPVNRKATVNGIRRKRMKMRMSMKIPSIYRAKRMTSHIREKTWMQLFSGLLWAFCRSLAAPTSNK